LIRQSGEGALQPFFQQAYDFTQQTATAEVLQVINSSPGNLMPVFDAMLDKAMRLCSATFGELQTYDGERFQLAAMRGLPAPYAEFRASRTHIYGPGTIPARFLAGEGLIHVSDVKADDAYRNGEPNRRALVDLGGARTVAAVPLLKDAAVLGFINVYRQEVRPFSDKKIALLQNFAAQAVIAMENARLLTETREALEQQTATAEVLQVINSSPGDLSPVFDAMLAKALYLCEGVQGSLWTFEGQPRFAAAQGLSAEFVEILREQWERRGPSEHHPMSRLMRGERVVQLLDIAASDLYLTGDPTAVAAVELGRVRTLLFVALLKDDAPFGAFIIARREVRPFTDKQIALVQNFAAQAVIAMENARLLTETREALEQQTATADVLQVINSSPGDLRPVFHAILEKAHTLCGAAHGSLMTYDGEFFRAAALHDMAEPLASWLREPFRSAPGDVRERLQGERFIHAPDIAALEYSNPERQAALDAGVRTVLVVPLRKDGALLGYITANRREVRPFSDKQIVLLQNFAAQAVIAMENARLLTETREALEQQTATAEVLQVINSSPGDLAPVFDAMLERATRLCEAAFGVLHIYDGVRFHPVSTLGVPGAYVDYLKRDSPEFGPGTGPARVLAGERVVHIVNMVDTEAYRAGEPNRRAIVDLGGARSALGVPLLKDEVVLGHFTIYRQQVRPFTEKQIALLQNFAAQAVIAVENARLLTETREALEQQTATSEVLQVINSSPGDLAPVFGAILEKAHGLCGITYGALEPYEDGKIRAVAVRGVSGPFADLLHQAFDPPPGSPPARLLAGKTNRPNYRYVRAGSSASGRSESTSRCPLRITHRAVRAAAKRRGSAGPHSGVSPRGASILRERDRVTGKFRGAGGHRDGECAAYYRDARSLGTANCNRRDLACHRRLDGQCTAGVRCHRRRCGTADRCVPIRRSHL